MIAGTRSSGPRVERLDIHPYALPLRRDWRSAHGGMTRRRGWLVVIEAEGLRGFGDCAPLPAAGTEGLAAAEAALLALRAEAPGTPVEALTRRLDERAAWTPAARFALDCASSDLLSRAAGRPLRQALASKAPDSIPVSAIAGALMHTEIETLQTLIQTGFEVIKLKVGLAPPTLELARLRALAAALPTGIQLRLDANRAWDPPDAAAMIAGLAGLPIESLEEPLSDPDPRALARLGARAAFPLALDESLANWPNGPDLAARGARRLVIKPAVIGGLGRGLALAEAARHQGLEVLVTSLVESAAGLWPTAQLAAAIGGTIPHGLATADWLAADLGVSPHPRGGRLVLPPSAGSGFAPDTGATRDVPSAPQPKPRAC